MVVRNMLASSVVVVMQKRLSSTRQGDDVSLSVSLGTAGAVLL